MSATEVVAPTSDEVAALHDRALQVVQSVLQPALLEEARQLLKAAGIGAARTKVAELRKAVADAPDIVANARERLLAAQDRERQARESYETALAEAEWALDGRFVAESNKTFLVTWHRPDEVSGEDEAKARGWTLVANGGQDAWQERRQMTADERRQWVARTASQAREVAPLASGLRQAEHAVALARIEVDTAENRWQGTRAALTAAIADVEAACAEVACLARSLGGAA